MLLRRRSRTLQWYEIRLTLQAVASGVDRPTSSSRALAPRSASSCSQPDLDAPAFPKPVRGAASAKTWTEVIWLYGTAGRGRRAGGGLHGRLCAWYAASSSAVVTPPSTGCVGSALCQARQIDAVAAVQQHGERADLHVAESGQRAEARVQVGAVGGLGPHARAFAVVVARRARGTAPARGAPCWPGSGGSPAARRTTAMNASVHRGDARRIEVAEAVEQHLGPEKAFWTGTCWSSTKPISSALASAASSRWPPRRRSTGCSRAPW